ncbi:MAG TPA: sulfotransferase [Pseudomonadales bacterium]
MPISRAAGDDFSVDRLTHLLSGAAARCDGLLKRLGRFETRLLEDRLGPVDRPVYVAGLARSGSTLLLEILDWHPDVVTHRYRDFPLLHVPVLWNRFLDHAARDPGAPRERAHRDGIMITRDSPEAFEEVLWMSFFPHLHETGRTSVLDGSTQHPEFEAFYRDHIRKLLMLRGGSRYVSKGNYNVTRLEYLLRLFPDARFVVPVRNPYWHVASLIKQQKLFLAGQADNARALAHLQRAGHFEFGLDRRVIHTGDDAAVASVLTCWQDGREVEGWARYWSMIYGFVIDRLEAHPELAAATLLLPYEALCREPARTAEILFEHCALTPSAELTRRAAERVRFPDYYTPDLSDADRELIARVTGETTRRLREYSHAAAVAVGEGMQIA